MGFGAIGLTLFYLAYRYNILYVYDLNIDTKGLVYPRALQQIFVGLYLAEVCLIGLFAIQLNNGPGAIGPFVMLIMLLIFTALYQLSLNEAIGPLLMYLPKTLDAEERNLLEVENGFEGGGQEDAYRGDSHGEASLSHHKEEGPLATSHPSHPANKKKPSMLTKFLKPHVYSDYNEMRKMVPHEFAQIQYGPEIERDAFFNPSVTTPTPVLWIPRDACGVSRQEVRDTGRVLPISDECARFDEKNRIVWDRESRMIPIFEEKIFY